MGDEVSEHSTNFCWVCFAEKMPDNNIYCTIYYEPKRMKYTRTNTNIRICVRKKKKLSDLCVLSGKVQSFLIFEYKKSNQHTWHVVKLVLTPSERQTLINNIPFRCCAEFSALTSTLGSLLNISTHTNEKIIIYFKKREEKES